MYSQLTNKQLFKVKKAQVVVNDLYPSGFENLYPTPFTVVI